MRFRWELSLAVLLGGLVLGGGCKHAPKKPALDGAPGGKSAEQTVPAKVSLYHLHKLVPYTLRVRRPPVAGANPKAGPGGIDYRTDPLPDERYDCKETASLFAQVKLAELRACVGNLPAVRVLYLLKRAPVPTLELDDLDEAPPCLRSLLPVLPLPREIFFQSTEGDRLACYSSRIGVESDEIAGFKLPLHRAAVKLDFPLAAQPKDDAETLALLTGWAISAFWESPANTIPAHLVPDVICARCLGEKSMLKPGGPEPLLWPD